MDKFSYSIGLGIGQNLSSMGIGNLAVDDFAQAIKDVLEGNQTAISHNEAREIATALILDSNSSKYLFTFSRASLWLVAV